MVPMCSHSWEQLHADTPPIHLRTAASNPLDPNSSPAPPFLPWGRLDLTLPPSFTGQSSVTSAWTILLCHTHTHALSRPLQDAETSAWFHFILQFVPSYLKKFLSSFCLFFSLPLSLPFGLWWNKRLKRKNHTTKITSDPLQGNISDLLKSRAVYFEGQFDREKASVIQ